MTIASADTTLARAAEMLAEIPTLIAETQAAIARAAEALASTGTPTIPIPDPTTAARHWRQRNDLGCGYPVGDPTGDINEVEGLGALILRAHTSQDVAVYRDGGTDTAVGSAHGPWAITL